MISFVTDRAKEISAQKLKISRALDLASFLKRPNVPFVRFVRCNASDDGRLEAVVFEVDVELGQKKIYDIRERELVAAVFESEDKLTPDILALRQDFPNTPHQNSRTFDWPRSLCLDERPYYEQKLNWSALGFVERIREWLRLTARGELHQDDQQLEPLLGAVDETIIIPHDFAKRFGADTLTPISVSLLNNTPGKIVLRAYVDNSSEQGKKAPIIATTFTTPIVEHGIINRQPQNLLELHEFCKKTRYDLLGELGTRLRNWIEGKAIPGVEGAKLVLIGIFPKQRRLNLPAEISDVWVFCSTDPIQKIAMALGVLAKVHGITSPTLNFGRQKNIVNEAQVKEIAILPVRPVYSLSPKRAALYNSFAEAVASKVVAVGMGALGSQIFNNMLRSGFGSWTLIDKDILLPHNCARHALTGNWVGYNKTDSLAYLADFTINGISRTASIPVDVLDPGEKGEDLRKAFAQADVIFDFSASIPVAHHLARNVETKARLISVFLNLKGTDLVILAEDAKKRFPLIWLEKEFFRFVASQPSLAGHLSVNQSAVRYSRSCGDMSGRMNQNLIALHAAIASENLRKLSNVGSHAMIVQSANPEDFSVVKQNFEPARFKTKRISDWTIYISKTVENKINALRKERLPNETGGVLIGGFDRDHRSIYVVDVLASPSDSTERPYFYVRGTRGLRPEIERIRNVTLSNLDYVGEWHSHPRGCSASMSNTDKGSLHKLAEQMNRGSLPALMLIAADGNRQELFLTPV